MIAAGVLQTPDFLNALDRGGTTYVRNLQNVIVSVGTVMANPNERKKKVNASPGGIINEI